MSGLNYLANALLIDSVDKVINKLLDARNYAVIHKLQIEPSIEADFNSVCKNFLRYRKK
jgi:hypothetical protein